MRNLGLQRCLRNSKSNKNPLLILGLSTETLNDVKALINADQVIYWQVKESEAAGSNKQVRMLFTLADELNNVCLYGGENAIEKMNEIFNSAQRRTWCQESLAHPYELRNHNSQAFRKAWRRCLSVQGG